MKVKNIVFSGFMAMVLAGACGAANAEIIVASQKYVDTKLGSVNTELSDKITALETANADGGSVANAIAEAKQVGTNAQGAVDTLAEKMDLTDSTSELSTALAAKEDTANKITTTNATYFTNGKVAEGALTTMASDNTNFPTVAAAVQIADAKALAVVNEINEAAGDLGELSNNVGTLIANDQTPGSVAYQVKQEETRAMAAEAQVLTDAKAYADGLASNYDAAGSAATAESNAKAYADQAEADAIASAKQYTDSLADNYDVAGSATNALTEAKAYTDAAATATDGTLSGGFVKEYVDEKIGILQGNTGLGGIQTELGQQQEEIDGLGEALEAEVLRATAAEQKIATYDENGNLTGGSVKANADAITALTNGAVQDNTDAIAAEKSRAEGVEAGLQTAIDTINNNTTGILATAKAYTNSEMTKFYANASECVTSSESNNCIMSAKLDGENNVQYVWISLTSPAE